jgi:hypothetical protein
MKKHGKSSSPTYVSWACMKARCYNIHHIAFNRYGGRGIIVCDRWKDSFINFLEDMGERPFGKTLDRIDGNDNYCKENCKWSTLKEQQHNMVKSFVFIDGEKIHWKDLCREHKIDCDTFKHRINKGWTIEEIFNPLLRRKKTLILTINRSLSPREELIKNQWENGETLEEIGNKIGITRERVRQIIKNLTKILDS